MYFGPPHRRGRARGQHLVDGRATPGAAPGAASSSAPTRDASGCRPPRGAARSPAARGHAPRTTPGTAPAAARRRRASGRWRSRPRRTPGTARRPRGRRPRGRALAGGSTGNRNEDRHHCRTPRTHHGTPETPERPTTHARSTTRTPPGRGNGPTTIDAGSISCLKCCARPSRLR